MTIGREMLAAAGKARRLLGDPAGTGQFLRRRLLGDGGFADRAGRSDLYYTVFALQALAALGEPLAAERIAAYLGGFGAGADLDLVHLSCLVRSWSCLGGAATPGDVRAEAARRLAEQRCDDGGFGLQGAAPAGSAYGCFLALSMAQDLSVELADPDGLARCLASLREPDGAYANDRLVPIGSVPATAAAVAVLHHLGRPARDETAAWLRAQQAPTGGFLAVPVAPEADLLSTATALHALRILSAEVGTIRAACLAFVRSLAREGGFAGHAADDLADCEYTFYGLLSLGQLAA